MTFRGIGRKLSHTFAWTFCHNLRILHCCTVDVDANQGIVLLWGLNSIESDTIPRKTRGAWTRRLNSSSLTTSDTAFGSVSQFPGRNDPRSGFTPDSQGLLEIPLRDGIFYI